MTTFDNDFAAPASVNGFVWGDHKGTLLIIEPTALENISTTFGEKDAVRADLVVADGDDAGQKYNDCLVFPSVLIGQLRPHIGKKVLGRLSQGVAKPGQSAPWKLDDPTAADIATAKAVLNGGNSAASPPF